MSSALPTPVARIENNNIAAQESIVARIENNNIVAQESVNISISVNVYQRDHRASQTFLCNGQGDKTELIEKVADLENIARKFEDTLRGVVDSSGEYLALTAVLERILEVTIPRITGLASKNQLTQSPTEVKLLAEVNYLLALLEGFSQKVLTEPCGLRLKPRYTRRAKPPRTLSNNNSNTVVKKLHRELERSCGRADSILLSLYKDPGPSVLEQQTEIEDFFGACWFLPQYICLNRLAFNAVLHAKYEGGAAENVISTGRFKVFPRGRTEIIDQNDWERAISAEDSIQLSVLVQRLQVENTSRVDSTMVQCPRCRHPQMIQVGRSEGWVECGQCQSSFTINFKEEREDDGIQTLQSPGANGSITENTTYECSSFRYYTIESPSGRRHFLDPHDGYNVIYDNHVSRPRSSTTTSEQRPSTSSRGGGDLPRPEYIPDPSDEWDTVNESEVHSSSSLSPSHPRGVPEGDRNVTACEHRSASRVGLPACSASTATIHGGTFTNYETPTPAYIIQISSPLFLGPATPASRGFSQDLRTSELDADVSIKCCTRGSDERAFPVQNLASAPERCSPSGTPAEPGLSSGWSHIYKILARFSVLS